MLVSQELLCLSSIPEALYEVQHPGPEVQPSPSFLSNRQIRAVCLDLALLNPRRKRKRLAKVTPPKLLLQITRAANVGCRNRTVTNHAHNRAGNASALLFLVSKSSPWSMNSTHELRASLRVIIKCLVPSFTDLKSCLALWESILALIIQISRNVVPPLLMERLFGRS